MPLDHTNPSYLKFMVENIEKGQERRMLWFTRHQKELEKKAGYPGEFQDILTKQVQHVPIKMCLPTFAVNYKNALVHHRKKPKRDGPILGLSDLTRPISSKVEIAPKSVMLPVEPSVENIRYQSLPYGGRVQYLKERNRKDPEDKYYSEETSSQVLGWRLKDSKLANQPAKFGRYNTFIHDLNSRSGPQPDPVYYNKPLPENYSFCD